MRGCYSILLKQRQFETHPYKLLTVNGYLNDTDAFITRILLREL